jgi:predicted SprT family Zn-dependent metalloprotease
MGGLIRQLEFVFDRPKPCGEPPPVAPLLDLARQLLAGIGWATGAEKVVVRWNARMRSAAGRAYTRKLVVELNPRLAGFGESEIEQTLRHELAHLVAGWRAGSKRIPPHGAEWRRACADLGIRGEKACHRLPLPARAVARNHTYRCPVCGVEFRRVRPFRAAVACMNCCRKHNRGRYDQRFRLEKVRVKS